MSESKRVQLTTVQPQQKEKKQQKKTKSYRFVLNLGESNAETCPEYSFAELIKNEKPEASDDPFFDGDEDGEVAAIAKRFEAKYGPKSAYSGKKKRTKEMDDYYDLGDGYDIDDPFIDNTEAYDEVIPSTLTTKHGGFYINQGKLDFKTVSDDSISAFTSSRDTPPKRKKKKGALDSDSEEEETGEALAKKFKAMKRKRLLEGKEGDRKKKKLSDGSKLDAKKKKKKLKKLAKLRGMSGSETAALSSPGVVNTPTVTTSVATPSSNTPAAESVTAPTTTSAVPPPQPNPAPLHKPQVVVSSATSLAATNLTASVTAPASVASASLVADAQAVTNGVTGKPEGKPSTGVTSSEERSSPNEVGMDVVVDESSSKSGDEGRGEQQSGEKNTQLPPELPTDLFNSIESIKKHAKMNTEGKCKFFSPTINKLLLEIELASYKLARGSRTAIFCHLGEHLPCGKPALHRRAKKLRETQEEDELNGPLERLKTAINALMPALQQQHKLEVLKAKEEAEKEKSTSDKPKEDGSTESDEDEAKPETPVTTKKQRRPKRTFPWSAETRRLLSDVVAVKMKVYKTGVVRGQTAEEYMKPFLDTVVRPLWPPGWMQTRILLKESKVCNEDLAKATLPLKPTPTVNKPSPAVNNSDDVSATIPVSNTSQGSRVSKTEEVIEISSTPTNTSASSNGRGKNPNPQANAANKDTVVVFLPGSSKASTPAVRDVPSTAVPPVSKSPVVIDITESPAKEAGRTEPVLSSSSSSTISSQSKLAASKIFNTPKQGQHQLSMSKASVLRDEIANIVHNRSQQLQQKTSVAQVVQPNHQHQPQGNRSIPSIPQSQQPSNTQTSKPYSTLVKPASTAVKSGEVSSAALSRWQAGNKSVYHQAKVVLKPVTVSPQGSVVTAVQQVKNQSKSISNKQPVSFNPVDQLQTQSKSTFLPTKQSLPSSISLPQQQQKKVHAVPGGTNLKDRNVSVVGGAQHHPHQQVMSGIVVATSSSHQTARLPPHPQTVSAMAQSLPTANKARSWQEWKESFQHQQLSPGSNKLAATVSKTPTQGTVNIQISSTSSTSVPSINQSSISRSPQMGRPSSSTHQTAYRSQNPPPAHTGSNSLTKMQGPTLANPMTSPTANRRVSLSAVKSPSARAGSSSTPSPQVVHTSTGDTRDKLTAFEQLTSQVRSQEAMEGQALKNLALVRNFMGYSGSSGGVSGK